MSTSALQQRLSMFRRRMIGTGVGGGVGLGILCIVMVLLLCMWLDLLVEMPSWLRMGCGIIALLAGGVPALRMVQVSLRRSIPHALARRLDEVSSAGGQILSGVDLWMRGAPAAAAAPSLVTAGLSDIAVNRAAELIGRIAPAEAVPARPVFRPYLALGFVLLVSGTVAFFAPRLAGTQLARFFDPWGDHPPYSRLSFTVEPGNARVIYGNGMDIRATIEGGVVERVELVSRTRDGSSEDVLPMFPESDGRWRATLATVTDPARYYVRTRGARSRQFDLDVITVPSIERVSFRIIPPAYTNRPPYDGALPQGGIAGLRGTVVQVKAQSNRPLSGGAIALSTGVGRSIVQLTTETPQSHEVVGEFVIDQPGRMELKVADVAGQQSTDIFSAAVNVLLDERPFVRIAQPMPNSFATPDAVLEAVILAEDDFGVARVQLFRALNESRARPTDLSMPLPPPARLTTGERMDLAGHSLKPGDVIKLYARVEDNDPVGMKGSESTVTTVRIISQEEFQRLILAQRGLEAFQSKYEAASRRLEQIDAEIEKLLEELQQANPDSELADELRQKIAELAHQMQKHANEIEKSAKFELPVDLDRALSQQLKDVAAHTRESAEQAQQLSLRASLSVAGADRELRKLRARLQGQRDEFDEQVIQPLEHLASIMPLLEDQQRFVMVYEAQRSLADRLDSLRNQNPATDPSIRARMRDLEAEELLLRDELAALLEDISEHAARLPDDPQLDQLRNSAVAFVKLVSASTADEQMTRAQTALIDFFGREAHAGAINAADILESFLSKCNSMGGEGEMCLRFNPGLASALGNTLSQLLAAGLGSGRGMGSGRGGFSMRSNTLANVGIYGSMPTASMPGGSGGGRDGRGASAHSRGHDDADAALIGFPARLRASGAAQTAVPPQYKRRVGEYFQRVADELSP